MTEKELILKYHCNPERCSGACDYAKYTEDDPICQHCTMQFVAVLRAYKTVDEMQDECEKLDEIKQIVDNWNNDASHSFEDMCKINGILKE